MSSAPPFSCAPVFFRSVAPFLMFSLSFSYGSYVFAWIVALLKCYNICRKPGKVSGRLSEKWTGEDGEAAGAEPAGGRGAALRGVARRRHHVRLRPPAGSELLFGGAIAGLRPARRAHPGAVRRSGTGLTAAGLRGIFSAGLQETRPRRRAFGWSSSLGSASLSVSDVKSSGVKLLSCVSFFLWHIFVEFRNFMS